MRDPSDGLGDRVPDPEGAETLLSWILLLSCIDLYYHVNNNMIMRKESDSVPIRGASDIE